MCVRRRLSTELDSQICTSHDTQTYYDIPSVAHQNRYAILEDMATSGEGISFGVGRRIGRGRAKRNRQHSSPTVGNDQPRKKQNVRNLSDSTNQQQQAESETTQFQDDETSNNPLNGSDFW